MVSGKPRRYIVDVDNTTIHGSRQVKQKSQLKVQNAKFGDATSSTQHSSSRSQGFKAEHPPFTKPSTCQTPQYSQFNAQVANVGSKYRLLSSKVELNQISPYSLCSIHSCIQTGVYKSMRSRTTIGSDHWLKWNSPRLCKDVGDCWFCHPGSNDRFDRR